MDIKQEKKVNGESTSASKLHDALSSSDQAYFDEYFSEVESDIEKEREKNSALLNAHYDRIREEVNTCKVKFYEKLDTTRLDDTFHQQSKAFGEYKKNIAACNQSSLINESQIAESQLRTKAINASRSFDAKLKAFETNYKEEFIGDASVQFRPNDKQVSFESNSGHLQFAKSIDSLICTPQHKRDLVKMCSLSKFEFELVYRATRDGFGASEFHRKCDRTPSTLTIIRTTDGDIFGAYSALEWGPKISRQADPNAFVFSLVNRCERPVLFKPTKAELIFEYSNLWGPAFYYRSQCLISIINDSNKPNEFSQNTFNLESCVNISGILNDGVNHSQPNASTFLTNEIEVFRIS